MQQTSTIRYSTLARISVQAYCELYNHIHHPKPRPIQHPSIISQLIEKANVLITAWSTPNQLVGLIRGLSDYTCLCYINDIFVHKSLDEKTIKAQMLKHLTQTVGKDCQILYHESFWNTETTIDHQISPVQAHHIA